MSQSILLSPLQLVLWGPLQPPRVSQSQGISFPADEVGAGAFSNDFSGAFDVYGQYPFSSDFSLDFATSSSFKTHSFSSDFGSDFDRTKVGLILSFNPDFSSDFNIMAPTHAAAYNNDFNNDFATTI